MNTSRLTAEQFRRVLQEGMPSVAARPVDVVSLESGRAVLRMTTAEADRMLAAAASAVMVLLVLFVHFVIAPELAFVDRSLTADPALRRNAGMLGGVYSALELVKFLIGAALSAYLFAFKNGSRRRVRRELDAIDPASLRTD